ncbi:MAG: hypothetical protein KC776_03195 [Myxococcales bacterium]|nr:hypothetical protein [Myxococcales bacterium]MCB9579995.1 hypothetical protein [Polyangiaceae bacterium]
MADHVLTPGVLAVLSGVSVLFLLASLIGIPWLVARLPADYFVRRHTLPPPGALRHDYLRLAWRVARNAFGVLLLLAGIAMLVLPGQGIVTIIVSLVFLSFPGKRRMLRKLVSRPRVLAAMNSLRRRAGREPLEME